MEEQNILDIRTRNEFRQWLETHHATEKACWVGVKRGRPTDDGTFYYLDAVEEALCFGWIDSRQKPINGVLMQCFTPRKRNSPWSELNKERARRLEKLGRMTDAGRRVLPPMGDFSFLQGEAMGRPSVVATRVTPDGTIYVGGTAAVVAEGELLTE